MKIRSVLSGLLAAVMLVSLCGPVGAKTVYVRTDGNDSNDGLSDTPTGAKATFQAAVVASVGGDVIQFAPGTYNEAGATRILFFGDLTFRSGNPAQKAVLSTLALRISGTVANVTFENLVFDDGFTHREVIYVENGAANLAFVGCEFKNPLLDADSPASDLRRGLIMVEGCNGLLVDGCKFSIIPSTNINVAVNMWCLGNLRDYLGAGFASGNWTVRDSDFHTERHPSQTTDADGGGIIFHESIANVLIAGCTFSTVFECFRMESAVTPDGPRQFTNLTFRNNGLQYTETSNALFLGSGNLYRDLSIRDNLFVAIEDTGVWIEGGGTATLDGGEIVGNDMRDIGYNGQGTDNAIRLDDAFLNPTPGKKVSIRNNRFIRPSVGADECLWLNAIGPGLEVVGNEISNYRTNAMLVDGSEKNPGTGALLDAVISDNAILNSGDTGIYLRTTLEPITGIAVENNLLLNTTPYAVNVRTALTTNARIRGNTFMGNGVGVRVSAAGAIVTQNEVFTSSTVTGGGIQLAESSTVGAASSVANCIVSFNAVAANRNYGIVLASAMANSGAGARVFNNTLVSNLNNGILIGVNNAHVYNNIVALHPGIGLNLTAGTPGTIGYNLLYNQVVGGANYAGFTTTPLPGDLSADPRFENVGARDYHLRSNSPAIGAGAALVGGNLVADGSDLGAFPTQIVSSAVPTGAWELYR